MNLKNPHKTVQGLYAITDQRLIAVKKFAVKVRQALEGGASVIQYRDKSQHHQQRLDQASVVVELCNDFGATSIINDDIELAKMVNADGVHLGAEDDEVSFARAELGEHKIIGVSCYADIALAEQAVNNSANYVAFGSVFPSSTKPQAPVAGLEVLLAAKEKLSVPIVAIGGISLDNLSQVIATNVDSVATISGVFGNDDVADAAKQFSSAFSKC